MLKTRSLAILSHLLQSDHPLTIRCLAERTSVNERTVRYDLENLQDWLKRRDIVLKRVPNVGTWLDIDEESRQQLLLQVGSNPYKQMVYSSEQRRKTMLIELLLRNEPIIAKEFEILLKVSESTVLRDLNELDGEIQSDLLNVLRKPNYGIYLSGSERAWRNKMFQLLAEESGEEWPITLTLRKKLDLVENGSNQLEQILRQETKAAGMKLPDSAVSALIFHLSIALYRIAQGRTIGLPRQQEEYSKHSKEFAVAISICHKLSRSSDRIPEEEMCNIAMLLMASKSEHFTDYSQEREATDTVLPAVVKMVEIAEQILGTSFKNDSDLIWGLVTHFRPMIKRIRFHIAGFKSELDMRSYYPMVYHATEIGAKAIEEMLGITIPPGEIAYLAAYIGAAMERQSAGRHTRPIRALLLCGSGLGTVQMLKERVLNEFPHFEVWDTCSVEELDQFSDKGIDICLSTVPITHPSFEVIPCSPMLGTIDIETIKNWLHRGEHAGDLSETMTAEIVDIVSKLGLHHRDLRKEVSKYLLKRRIAWNRPFAHHSNRKEDLKVLTDLLTPETVDYAETCGDWMEAVLRCGTMLERSACIEKRYTDAVLQAIKKHGPYMVIAPGIALLHARPEDGVKEVCMSLQIISAGVQFGHHSRDPVNLVFMFGTTDSRSHLQALSELMNLINDEPLLTSLRVSGSVPEALEVFQQLGRKYNKEDLKC